MRKNIVMISQNTHAFLANEIEYATDVFERVIVICPHDDEIKKAILRLPNAEMLFYSKQELYLNALFSIPRILEKEKREEIAECLNSKSFTKAYLKQYLNFLALMRLFEKALSRKIKLSVNESNEWVFYSAWYYGTAFAVTEAKKKYKYAKTISLAHSFEIDKMKNKNIYLLFRKFYHNRLDKVSFISKNVFRKYRKEIANKLNLSLNNIEVRYLGAKKLIQGMNHASIDGVIRIVSCSNVIRVKRIDLILHALDGIKEVSIEWTHIGNGELMNYIKDLIKKKTNKDLNVKLMGAIENSKIHEYYEKNPVDLFINVSLSEGIPVSIMEAIAYGIPIIATDVGGNSEIVKEDFGKLISSNPNCDEIREAVKSIINLPDKEKKEMRKNATYFFENSFNANLLRRDFFLMLKNYG